MSTRYVYLIEKETNRPRYCKINGRNVIPIGTKRKAEQSFPVGSKFDWLDSTALVLNERENIVGYITKKEVY